MASKKTGTAPNWQPNRRMRIFVDTPKLKYYTMEAAVDQKVTIEDLLEQGAEVTITGFSEEQFFKLAEAAPHLSLERTPNGNILVMTPIKGGSGIRENKLIIRIGSYCEKFLGGQTFSPSTGFRLPDGSTRSPDIAWLSPATIAQIPKEEIENAFIPLAPDFVVELRSKSDRLERLKDKMANTWIANGVQLGWLIDPYEETGLHLPTRHRRSSRNWF
jgi:Uma2 family endonuclease